jgi:Bifunctional DNA primase/polymerase, N-terminal
VTAQQDPGGWEQIAPGDLQEVNQLSVADALVWYTRHGYAARLASATAKMLALPKGYGFDELGVLSEEQLATEYRRSQQDPRLRVALILGALSDLVAIDVDDLAEWARFLAEHGDKIPPTALQATGRDGGGLHLLYRRGDLDPELLKQSRWPGSPAIELKTKAPLMAAPSRHASGRYCQWQPGPGRPVLISAELLAGFQQGLQQERAAVQQLTQQIEMAGRPDLNASNVADFADLLCELLGDGCFTGTYQRDDKLVIVPRLGESGYIPVKGAEKDPRKNSPAQIRAPNQQVLQGWVASRAWTYKFVEKRDGWERSHILPPLAACSAAIHADPARWTAVPVLSGVVHIPLLRRDGSLLATPRLRRGDRPALPAAAGAAHRDGARAPVRRGREGGR